MTVPARPAAAYTRGCRKGRGEEGRPRAEPFKSRRRDSWASTAVPAFRVPTLPARGPRRGGAARREACAQRRDAPGPALSMRPPTMAGHFLLAPIPESSSDYLLPKDIKLAVLGAGRVGKSGECPGD